MGIGNRGGGVATSSSKTDETQEWGVIWRENSVPRYTEKNKIQPINSNLPSTYLLVMMSDFAIYNKSFMQQWMVLFLQILWPFNESTKTFMSFQSTGESDTPSDNWGIDMPGVSGDIDKWGTEGLVSDGERGSTHIDLQLHFIGLFFLHFYFPNFLCAFLIFTSFLIQFTPSPHNRAQATVWTLTAEQSRARLTDENRTELNGAKNQKTKQHMMQHKIM